MLFRSSLTSLAIEGVSSQAAVSLELRDWLGALTNLAELSLKRSLLGCCPAELAALGALRRLDVSHSRLAGLPVELSRLTELEVGRWGYVRRGGWLKHKIDSCEVAVE